MSSEQPSLFDQLTPSDSLRDDLAWIDSLQEDTQRTTSPPGRNASHANAAAGRTFQPSTSLNSHSPATAGQTRTRA